MPETPSAAQHTLVSGPSAWAVATWIRRVFPIGFVVLGAVGATLIVDRLLPQIDLSRHLDVAFALLAIVLVPFGILTLLSRLRSNAEQEAGYSTVPGTRIDLDLVHPTTGTTVRRAGDRELSASEWKAVLAGDPLNRYISVAGAGGSVRFDRQQGPMRLLAVVVPLVAFAIFVGFSVVGLVSREPDRAARASSQLVIVVVVVAACVLGLGIYWFVQRGRTLSVRDKRPGAVVFTSQRVDELTQLLSLTHTEDVTVPWTFPVAVTDAGIELWPDASATEPAATFAWSGIKEVYPGRAVSTYGSRSSVVNSVRLRMGTPSEPVDMPIGVAGRIHTANAALDAIAQHARVVAAP